MAMEKSCKERIDQILQANLNDVIPLDSTDLEDKSSKVLSPVSLKKGTKLGFSSFVPCNRF